MYLCAWLFQYLFISPSHVICQKCIGNFSHLQELDCKNNHLQSLPSTLGRLSILVILNVTNNLLTELTGSIGQLTHLEELCAHSNQLTSLPDELCNLVNLTALYVGECQNCFYLRICDHPLPVLSLVLIEL